MKNSHNLPLATKFNRVVGIARGCMMATVLPAIFSVLVISAIVADTHIANAQNVVQDRASIVQLLNDQFSEKPVALGLANNGGLIEVFAAGDGSTWTMILSLPSGESRVLGEGSHWVGAPPPKREEQAVSY
jgi:hypothetical protein